MESNKPHFPARMNVATDFIHSPITAVKIAGRVKGYDMTTFEGALEVFRDISESNSNIADMKGFAWQSEGLQITPTCPFGNTGPEPIGFVEVANGNQIPEVRILKDFKLAAQYLDYEYKLHGYHGILITDMQIPDPADLGFVYITNSKALGSAMPKRFFMRFNDLKERLCGNYQQRQKLYTLDWLVGTTLRASKYTFSLPLSLNPEQQYKGMDRTDANTIVRAMDEAEKTDHPYRSHLPVWDLNGTLLHWSKSAEILGALLTPSMSSKDSKLELMHELYFRNLCRLVVAAAKAPRGPFTVMARFWSHPIEDQQTKKIQFKYMFPKSGSAWWNGIDEDGKLFWADTIKSAHKEVVKKLRESPNPMVFVPSDDCTVETVTKVQHETGDKFIWVGSHPQGLYDLYVPEEGLRCMKKQGFNPGCEKAPIDIGAKIVEWKGRIKDGRSTKEGDRPLIGDDGPLIEDDEPSREDDGLTRLDDESTKTVTAITREKLAQAYIWPRKCNQNSLMEGKGANEVAEDLYDRKNPSKRGMAEWLHRSAYSFGGIESWNGLLKPASPDTSQHRSNLVIGTYAANTRMIRYEEYLKRLVNQTDHTVVLRTSLVYEDLKHDGGKCIWPYPKDSKYNSSWIAPALDYTWLIRPPKLAEDLYYCGGAARIWLFSRNTPMRFEAMMDEALDMKLYKLYKERSPQAMALLDALWNPECDAITDEFNL